MDNIEFATAPLMLYLAETHKKEILKERNIQGILDRWLMC